MLNVPCSIIEDKVKGVLNYLNKNQTSALMFDRFIGHTLNQDFNSQYPKTVKIPKSLNDLLRGDYEPAQVIEIQKPIMYKDMPIWYGDSSDGVHIRIGFENGDTRKPCRQKLDDKFIHALLAGRTGMGKSVTLNDIVFGLAFEYAPWEAKLTMIDAKIAEFKRYADAFPLPHVCSIAATGDVDYIVSVLQKAVDEMTILSSVFAKAGVQNIKDFREKTGLVIPQNIIVIDEFQTLFKNAGKMLPTIVSLIDAVSRLGRSAGYHLFLASQGLGSDIPKDTANQIQVRLALGCSPSTSETILGNDEAKSIQQKGRLLLNVNPGEKKAEDNVFFRVPFQPSNQFAEQKKFLWEQGNVFQFKYDLSFYDELACTYEYEFKDSLANMPKSDDIIYLGEPSFVTEDPIKRVRIEFDRKDIENVMILNHSNKNLERYLKMFKTNADLMSKDTTHLVIYADVDLYESCGLEEISAFGGRIKTSSDPYLLAVYSSIFGRKLMIDVDERAFEDISFDEVGDRLFYEVFEKGSEYDTNINRARAGYMVALMNTKEYRECFGLGNINGEEFENVVKVKIQALFPNYVKYGAANSKLQNSMLPRLYIWLLGMNRILGMGRDPNRNDMKVLKSCLLDCCDYNARFIMTSTNFEEFGDLKSAIRYYILDDNAPMEISRIKCDCYPEVKPFILGILYDNINKKCLKFKKILLKGEQVVSSA